METKRNAHGIFHWKVIVLGVLLVLCMGTKTEVKAVAKDGRYSFSSCVVTKFQVKNHTLILKLSKADTGGHGITAPDGTDNKYTLKLKIAKNCKYYEQFSSRREMAPGSVKKSSYKKIKQYISGDRKTYKESGFANNLAESVITVKNNKAVEIRYCYLF